MGNDNGWPNGAQRQQQQQQQQQQYNKKARGHSVA